MTTPARPIPIPRTAAHGRRSLKKARPRIATQTGSSATKMAAIPDGTVRSPNATMPIPPKRRAPPTIAESRHSRRLGRWGRSAAGDPGVPRSRQAATASQASSTDPDNRNRTPAIMNGGIVSTATRIPM